MKRSVFIASASHAATAQKAHEFIDSIRRAYPDATHNCWAFVAGPPGDTRSIGMSDDGEPHGTAGRPMLNVLIHGKLGEVVCIVTRYYGGTKLGTGGLARAYSLAVEEVLKIVPQVERIPRINAKTIIDYSHLDPFRKLISQYEVIVENEVFTDRIAFELAIPEEHFESLKASLSNLTLGESSIEFSDDVDHQKKKSP